MSNNTTAILEKESFDRVKKLFCIIGAPMIFSLNIGLILYWISLPENATTSTVAYTQF